MSPLIRLDVLAPRKGHIRVAYDGDGMWHVACDYFLRGEWVYDQGLMTTEHVEKLTGKRLTPPEET